MLSNYLKLILYILRFISKFVRQMLMPCSYNRKAVSIPIIYGKYPILGYHLSGECWRAIAKKCATKLTIFIGKLSLEAGSHNPFFPFLFLSLVGRSNPGTRFQAAYMSRWTYCAELLIPLTFPKNMLPFRYRTMGFIALSTSSCPFCIHHHSCKRKFVFRRFSDN